MSLHEQKKQPSYFAQAQNAQNQVGAVLGASAGHTRDSETLNNLMPILASHLQLLCDALLILEARTEDIRDPLVPPSPLPPQPEGVPKLIGALRSNINSLSHLIDRLQSINSSFRI